MTKLDFIRKRLLALFASDDIAGKQKIVDNYNKIRKKKCYCGHTTTCDCGNPGIYEFECSLKTKSISENTLKKLL